LMRRSTVRLHQKRPSLILQARHGERMLEVGDPMVVGAGTEPDDTAVLGVVGG
jgi:hypothetical protein